MAWQDSYLILWIRIVVCLCCTTNVYSKTCWPLVSHLIAMMDTKEAIYLYEANVSLSCVTAHKMCVVGINRMFASSSSNYLVGDTLIDMT